jgi:hypothetical protein
MFGDRTAVRTNGKPEMIYFSSAPIPQSVPLYVGPWYAAGIGQLHLRSGVNIRRTHCDSLGASCDSLVEELPAVLW